MRSPQQTLPSSSVSFVPPGLGWSCHRAIAGCREAPCAFLWGLTPCLSSEVPSLLYPNPHLKICLLNPPQPPERDHNHLGGSQRHPHLCRCGRTTSVGLPPSHTVQASRISPGCSAKGRRPFHSTSASSSQPGTRRSVLWMRSSGRAQHNPALVGRHQRSCKTWEAGRNQRQSFLIFLWEEALQPSRGHAWKEHEGNSSADKAVAHPCHRQHLAA